MHDRTAERCIAISGRAVGLRRAAVDPLHHFGRPAGAYSAARYENGVRALKFVAAALAGALAAMAFMKYEDGKQAATTLVPDGNETVIPRQAPPKTYARARLSEPAVVQREADQSETSVAWNYPRAVRTVLFVNPASGASTAAATRELAEPDAGFELASATTRVGGFVAFSGKAAEQDAAELKFLAPRKGVAVLMEDVDQYLWEVYQRSPDQEGWLRRLHLEGSGRRQAGGHDIAGLRDRRHGPRLPRATLSCRKRDGRRRPQVDDAQRVPRRLSPDAWPPASRPRAGNSLHGGSRRTGGYGHGRAVDLTRADGNSEDVWKWIDDHGAKYGLYRPMPGNDPAHTQSRGDWRKLAQTLRTARVKETGLDKTKVVAAVTSKR